MSLASELRAVRSAAGLSQKAMATRAGISHSYLTEIERGARGWKPSLELLERLAKAAGESPSVFRSYRHEVVCRRWPDEVDKLYTRLVARG